MKPYPNPDQNFLTPNFNLIRNEIDSSLIAEDRALEDIFRQQKEEEV